MHALHSQLAVEEADKHSDYYSDIQGSFKFPLPILPAHGFTRWLLDLVSRAQFKLPPLPILPAHGFTRWLLWSLGLNSSSPPPYSASMHMDSAGGSSGLWGSIQTPYSASTWWLLWSTSAVGIDETGCAWRPHSN